jgi:hypothetical protein
VYDLWAITLGNDARPHHAFAWQRRHGVSEKVRTVMEWARKCALSWSERESAHCHGVSEKVRKRESAHCHGVSEAFPPVNLCDACNWEKNLTFTHVFVKLPSRDHSGRIITYKQTRIDARVVNLHVPAISRPKQRARSPPHKHAHARTHTRTPLKNGWRHS